VSQASCHCGSTYFQNIPLNLPSSVWSTLCISHGYYLRSSNSDRHDFNHRLHQAQTSAASYHLPKLPQKHLSPPLSIREARTVSTLLLVQSHSFLGAAPWAATWPDPEKALVLSVTGFNHTACSDSKSILKKRSDFLDWWSHNRQGLYHYRRKEKKQIMDKHTFLKRDIRRANSHILFRTKVRDPSRNLQFCIVQHATSKRWLACKQQ
jgi:hypothetical protein